MTVENPDFTYQNRAIPTEVEVEELDKTLVVFDLTKKACATTAVVGVIAFGAGIALLKEDAGNELIGGSLEFSGVILATYGSYLFYEARKVLNDTRNQVEKLGLKIKKSRFSLRVEKTNYQPSLLAET